MSRAAAAAGRARSRRVKSYGRPAKYTSRRSGSVIRDAHRGEQRSIARGEGRSSPSAAVPMCPSTFLLCRLGIIFLWLALTCCRRGVAEEERSRETPEGRRYPATVTVRRVADAAEAADASATPSGSDSGSGATPNLHVEVAFGNRSFELRLERQIVYAAEGYAVWVRKAGSTEVIRDAGLEFCYYQGDVVGIGGSSATFILCGALSGAFTANGYTYVVETAHANGSSYYIFEDRPSYVRKDCGVSIAPVHSSYRRRMTRPRPSRLAGVRRRRGAPRAMRPPAGTSDTTSFVELYLVLDNAFFRKHGGQSRARGYKIINYANFLLRKVDVYLILVGMEVWEDYDRSPVTENSSETLANFVQYRRTKISPHTPNDNAQLISGRAKFALDQGVVGKAYIGGMCSPDSSGGFTLDNRDSFVATATTMVHELGHNLGLKHDDFDSPSLSGAAPRGGRSASQDESCSCAFDGGLCIMAGAVGETHPTHWSECSKSQLRHKLSMVSRKLCLKNLPELRTAWGTSFCGNYLVEGEEQCDCGPADQCDSACCDPVTCRLLPGAACATGECCDLTTCSMKAATTPCRLVSSTSGQPGDNSQCDLSEYCNGSSEYCPADLYVLNGTPCRNAGGPSYCHDGKCQTRSAQCQLLWGSDARDGDPFCYKFHNLAGDYWGHCGRNPQTGNLTPCRESQVWCGQLQCFLPGAISDDSLYKSLPSYARMTQHTNPYPNSEGVWIKCSTGILEVSQRGGKPVDVAMIPDGTACAEDRICLNQQCVQKAPPCSANCNGHGQCNTLGHCHCDYMFAPPACDAPGPGGSIDSGPASVYEADQALVVGFLVTLLGIAPLLAVVAVFVRRHKPSFSDLRSRILEGVSKTVCRRSLEGQRPEAGKPHLPSKNGGTVAAPAAANRPQETIRCHRAAPPVPLTKGTLSPVPCPNDPMSPLKKAYKNDIVNSSQQAVVPQHTEDAPGAQPVAVTSEKLSAKNGNNGSSPDRRAARPLLAPPPPPPSLKQVSGSASRPAAEIATTSAPKRPPAKAHVIPPPAAVLEHGNGASHKSKSKLPDWPPKQNPS